MLFEDIFKFITLTPVLTKRNYENMQLLPWEIIDEIFIFLAKPGLQLAVDFKRFSLAHRIGADFRWAIQKGNLEFLKYLNENGFCEKKYGRYCLAFCAQAGYLQVLKYCHEQIHPFKTSTRDTVLSYAASQGHFDLVRYLISLGGRAFLSINSVAGNGHLEIFKYIHENRSSFKVHACREAMDLAAENGHLEVVKWLHENSKEGNIESAMKNAARSGHLDILKWLHNIRKNRRALFAIDIAAENGHLEIIKWLNENIDELGSPWAMNTAAENGHLEVVKWLHENREEGCTTKAMDSAAENGHLEVLKWLHSNRKEGCTPRALNAAMRREHLEVEKWLRENCFVTSDSG